VVQIEDVNTPKKCPKSCTKEEKEKQVQEAMVALNVINDMSGVKTRNAVLKCNWKGYRSRRKGETALTQCLGRAERQLIF